MPYNPELVYPERKRCAACRSYFCWQVLAGLWCSRECAGIPKPSENPEDWPRQHYAMREGVKREKRAWESRRTAERKARQNRKEAYLCGYCLEFHIGSPDPEKVYPEPVIKLL